MLTYRGSMILILFILKQDFPPGKNKTCCFRKKFKDLFYCVLPGRNLILCQRPVTKVTDIILWITYTNYIALSDFSLYLLCALQNQDSRPSIQLVMARGDSVSYFVHLTLICISRYISFFNLLDTFPLHLYYYTTKTWILQQNLVKKNLNFEKKLSNMVRFWRSQ